MSTIPPAIAPTTGAVGNDVESLLEGATVATAVELELELVWVPKGSTCGVLDEAEVDVATFVVPVEDVPCEPGPGTILR